MPPFAVWLLYAVLAATLAATSQAQQLTFRYDPRYAAGVSGAIRVRYEPTRQHPNRAFISVDLDFSRVRRRDVKRLDARCPATPREYEWHLHTKWTAPHSSGSFEECSPRQAGNHYDPGRACGPSSQYVGTAICRPRLNMYRCTPSHYRQDPDACERGDLAGKFGNLVLSQSLRVKERFGDLHFPAFQNATNEWNVIVHPVCGRDTPRLACAVVRKNADGM